MKSKKNRGYKKEGKKHKMEKEKKEEGGEGREKSNYTVKKVFSQSCYTNVS